MLKNPIAYIVFLLGVVLQPAMAADSSKLTLTVTGKISSEKVRQEKDPKAKDPAPKQDVSMKTLEVHISSVSATDPGPLKVKCSLLARDIGAKTKIVQKEFTLDTQLENHQATVKTEPVKFANAPAYTTKKGEKVEASGQDYRGFEVLVMNAAGDVIGKAYSSPAIEEEIEKEAKEKK
jgi:hypothetical protein